MTSFFIVFLSTKYSTFFTSSSFHLMVRFHKSFWIGKFFRINISKSGIWASAWMKGMRVGTWPRWKYASLGIPWTWISWLWFLWKRKSKQPIVVADDDEMPPARLPKNFCQWTMYAIQPAESMSSRMATYAIRHTDWINQLLVLTVWHGQVWAKEKADMQLRLRIGYSELCNILDILEVFGFLSTEDEESHREVVSQKFMENYIARNGGSFEFPQVLCSCCRNETDEDTFVCKTCWYDPNNESDDWLYERSELCWKCLLPMKYDSDWKMLPCDECWYDAYLDEGKGLVFPYWK